MDKLNLYEIYVPTIRNDGKPIRTRQHREWDRRVRRISGGLTIYKPSIGQWIDSESGLLYKERMIPVRIATDSESMKKIAHMTKKFYEQLAVLYYKISDEVYFV